MDTLNNHEKSIQSLSGRILEWRNLYGDICHIKDKSDVKLCITTKEFSIISGGATRIVITFDNVKTLIYRGHDKDENKFGISWNLNTDSPYIAIFCLDKNDKLIAHFTLSSK